MSQISSSLEPTAATPSIASSVVSAEQLDTCRALIADAIDAGFTRVALLEAPQHDGDEQPPFVRYIVSSLKTEDARLEFEWTPTQRTLGAALSSAPSQTYQLVVSWEAAVKTIVEYNKARRRLV